MNLMKYFNYNYMLQNLKKSKSILIFFLGLIPIASIFSYLVLISNTSLDGITLEAISIIHYFGIYFIPILLSLCLFGFIYKKKQVDFTLSMPLSRKTIFTTNTITGILLLILMVTFSALGIYIVNLFTDFIIPFRMIMDYILIWSITYIFVFILTNIAMSISGNGITQFIVTMLLLFFIPFLIDCIQYSNPFYGVGDDANLCITSIDNCYYIENYKQANFTLPYNNIRILLFAKWQPLYNIVSLLKMVIISIIGFIVGKVFYVKRKMEINETSFSTLEIHNIVKAFTMFPIVVVITDFIKGDSMSNLGMIISILILVIYYLVYDLITRKSISNLKITFIHFCITLIILFPTCMVLCGQNKNNNLINISKSDITGYQFSKDDTSFNQIYYVDVKNSITTQMITDSLARSKNSLRNHKYNGNENEYVFKEMIIKANKKNYKVQNASFLKEDYDKIIEQIEKTEDTKNSNTLLAQNKIYALGLEEDYLRKYTNNHKVLESAKEVIETNKNDIKKDYTLCKILYLYAYDKGTVVTKTLNSCTSSVLSDYIEKEINKENQKFYSKIRINNIFEEVIEYSDNLTTLTKGELTRKCFENLDKIYKWILEHQDDEFSVKKPYISIGGNIENKNYIYYTNRVEEFLELLKEADNNDIN